MKYIFLILPFIFSTSVFAQDEATGHYQKGDYESAAKAYLKAHKKNKLDSAQEYNLGMSLINLAEYSRAIEHLKHAKTLNFPSAFADYNIAKAYALAKDKTMAMATLKDAAQHGMPMYARIKNDTAFSAYIEQPEMKPILQKIKENAYPCLTDPNFRHFDFWLGEWTVMAGGRNAGSNSITMANGGCVIHESYVTSGNYTGQSMNYYDPQDKKWHQIWVDTGGTVLDYVEIDKAEGMLKFQCDYLSPQGSINYSRLTFTLNEDGSVRQLFEGSTDGENWSPQFDGHYIKKESNQ